MAKSVDNFVIVSILIKSFHTEQYIRPAGWRFDKICRRLSDSGQYETLMEKAAACFVVIVGNFK